MKQAISRWLLQIYVYIYGIRFYRSDINDYSGGFRSLTIRSNSDRNIKMTFYELKLVDQVMRFGNLFESPTIVYIVKMDIHEDYPESIRTFDNAKIIFRSHYLNLWSKELISEVLYRACVDYITYEK